MRENNIIVIETSSYIIPDITPVIGRKWITNGEYNKFYNYIRDRYNGSPTNAGVINSYTAYIYGEGLSSDGTSIPLLSNSDTRLICQDYYTYGAYAIQIIWNLARTHPVKIKYTPVYKYGLNQNSDGDIDGYWYCYDWLKTWRYRPEFFNKFTGSYTGNDIEVLIVQRPSSNNYFSNPSYISGLQYAQMEEELSNASINHILNGFSAGKVINIYNSSGSLDEDTKEEYAKKVKEKLTGSTNTNKVIVSVNDNPDSKITVDTIELPKLNEQYVYFSEESKKQIFAAHSVTSPALFGQRDGGGLGNNSEEMSTARKELYRMIIKPAREVIIDGLNEVLNITQEKYNPKFTDFSDYNL